MYCKPTRSWLAAVRYCLTRVFLIVRMLFHSGWGVGATRSWLAAVHFSGHCIVTENDKANTLRRKKEWISLLSFWNIISLRRLAAVKYYLTRLLLAVSKTSLSVSTWQKYLLLQSFNRYVRYYLTRLFLILSKTGLSGTTWQEYFW